MTPRTPIQLASPAPAGEVSRGSVTEGVFVETGRAFASSPGHPGEVALPQAVSEGASSPLLPRPDGGGAEQSEAEGALSSCLPRPAGEVPAQPAEGVFLSPSGCHGLLRRTTRAPSSPSAPDHTNDQRIQEPGCHNSPQSGAVVLLQPPKDTTARLRREWCHPETSTPLPSPRGVAGETSPAQAIWCDSKLNRQQRSSQ